MENGIGLQRKKIPKKMRFCYKNNKNQQMGLPTEEILSYWFSGAGDTGMNAFWFDTSCDSYLTSHYKDLCDRLTPELVTQLIRTDQDKIALLLIGDQFTRNIYRDSEERTKNDAWALELALQLIQEEKDLQFPLNYRYFILLPLRHHKTSAMLDLVVERIQLYLTEFDPIPMTLLKFYTQTIKNYTDLSDRIVFSQGTPWKSEFTSVLESYPASHQDSMLNINNFEPERIALSLSGGVDSMVLLNLLKQNGKRVVAIHIEYCNRDEARLEREFLEYYCFLHHIPFYYQTIHYIKRESILDRSMFEEETRKVRFRMYQYVVEKEGLEGVCLGHHMGDIVENVFTNMIKGRTNDIMVMQEKQDMMGVTLFRPLLSNTKDELITMAHSHDIPYFLNSTPTWSCRGVLRNTVLPALKKQFGDIEANIIQFAKQYSYYATFHEKETNQKIKLTHHPYFSAMEIQPDCIHLFPNSLLTFMHQHGYAMASKKSISNFMMWYKGPRTTKIQLSKDVLGLEKNGILYIMDETKIKKEKPCITNLFT
jgi:tRNA(Ile)-lysidine synthetase-like protein